MQALELDQLRRVRIPHWPNEVREERVRTWLTSIDPSLDIRWMPTVVIVHDSADNMLHYEGRYALIMYLPSNDPEVAYARKVGIENPFSTLGWFCEDMSRAKSRPVPCDEMEPLVRGYLSTMDGSKMELKQRLRAIRERNAALQQRNVDRYSDEAVQRALDMRRKHMNVPFVSGYN